MINLNKKNKIWTKNNSRNNQEPPRGSEIETYEFLYGFTRLIKPTNVLETGTFEGDSATAMGQALQKNNHGHLWTIDRKDYGQVNFINNNNLDNEVTCLIGDIVTDIKKLNIPSFDLIFIDDGHLYSDVIRDLNLANELSSINSYILIHDYLDIPEVNKASNDFLSGNNNFEKVVLNSYFGILILKKI